MISNDTRKLPSPKLTLIMHSPDLTFQELLLACHKQEVPVSNK